METPKTLGAFLQAKRKELRLTLLEVATLCKTSKSYIWELEQDRSRPGFDMALKLADAMAFSLICYWDYLPKEVPVREERRQGERRVAVSGRRITTNSHVPEAEERRKTPLVGYVGRRLPYNPRRQP